MIHRIEILTTERHTDPVGASLLARMQAFGAQGIDSLRTCAVYSFAAEALAEAPNGNLAAEALAEAPNGNLAAEALAEAPNGAEALAANGDGNLNAAALQTLGTELFADPVLQRVCVDGEGLEHEPFDWYVEVGLRPGVTDNVGRTAQESLEYRLGHPLAAGHHVHTATGYFFRGALGREAVEALARNWLANELIQQVTVLGRDELAAGRERLFQLPRVELRETVHTERFSLRSADDVLALSVRRLLALSPPEAEAIRAYFADPDVRAAREAAGLDARATDVELEVLAQTWSEHCKHKIFNADITYTDEHGRTERVRSLYKTYIQGATATVRAALGADDWCLSVFRDNAGVVRFDDDWSFVFKVETHNSPSALDPYGGALTGIVGVNRDPFGTGQGAELLFNTDVFCFASPFYGAPDDAPLPPRLLHPRRIYEGVRLGVEHGGNKSGVPTVNGSLTFHERFLGKPLVFCGTGGLLPARIGGRPGHEKWVHPGDRIVMVGGRIGADGIHGATFSSLELSESSPVTAVQIGDPIVQKRMFDFLLRARDRGLFNAITDNGAGGLSSSVGEMATLCGERGGATLHLDRAPLKYPGLQPWEIFISEAQERMTLAVPPDKLDALLALSAEMEVESTDLGEFEDSGVLTALHGGELVARLDMDFLHDGLPRMQLTARWTPSAPLAATALPAGNLTPLLLRLLGRLNICSKEAIVRQYDHEVQGASVVKPLTGAQNDGPSDAAVLRPVLGSTRGLAIAHGICPRYSDLDTAAMAACAVDEAVRSVVAVGADPARIAGLDNFCWCDPLPAPNNPDAEHKLGQLVRAARTLHDVAVAYGVPLISGKDSMKNDYVNGDERLSVPPTLLFSAAGIVPDVRRAVTMDAKAAGDRVYLIGTTRDELGGSELLAELGLPGGDVPRLDAPAAHGAYRALHAAMQAGLVRSAHDCSDGGLAVALAETAFAGGLGMALDVAALAAREGLGPAALLFAESPARLVVTVAPAHAADLETALAGHACVALGEVTAAQRLIVRGADGVWIDAALADLKEAWQRTLRDL